MTEWQGIGLLPVYLLSVGWIACLLWRDFQRFRFNFHLFFSLLYFLTFYFGFPFTLLLAFQFEVKGIAVDYLLQALLSATAFYAIYYLSYKTRWLPARSRSVLSHLSMTGLECRLMMLLLALVAIATTAIFFLNNGFLLFKLQGYNQIFSASVSDVALKRFFYFFIPAMLLFYFIRENKRAWWCFLLATCLFGLFTYLIVGGTRANILIAFALFLFIGLIQRWISLSKLVIAGLFAIISMFYLALRRYGLQVDGSQAFYTFLYLTRDTFSPWENFARILSYYQQIEFQGLAPMVRDFYVFIPNWLWPARPHLILNTANYFTWQVLQNRSGLAMSPTLLGSLVIMGGWWFIPLGAIFIGWLIKGFDRLYHWALTCRVQSRYLSALLKTYCFGAVFNVIVLVREGLDAFGSRLVFFTLVFLCCLLLSKLIYWLCCRAGLVKLSPVLSLSK